METLTEQDRGNIGRTAAAPVLSVKNLQVQYTAEIGNVTAVDGVSFDIGAGEVFGLAGESGCGKSTIANAVMRLLQTPAKITGGSIELDGKNLLDLGEEELRRTRWRDVAMVFQSAMNSLNPVMTIGDQIVDVFTTHERMPKKAARERAAELLKLVDISPDRLKSYPHQLSGGMRQRAVIAIALALQTLPSHHGRTHHCPGRGGSAGHHAPDQRTSAAAGVFHSVHHPRHLTHGRALPPHGRDVCGKAGRDGRSKDIWRTRFTPTPTR